MSEKRKNDTIIEGEYYDPDLPAQENTPPQIQYIKHTRNCGKCQRLLAIKNKCAICIFFLIIIIYYFINLSLYI